MKLLFGDDENIAQWVCEHLPQYEARGFGAFSAIGVVSESGEPLAGVVFNEYKPQFRTMQITMVATSPRWATRNIVRSILAYPFLQVGVNKVWTATPHTNERALRFNKGIGFTQEATLAYQFGKSHAVICRLLRKDYLRLYEVDHGQQIKLAATGT